MRKPGDAPGAEAFAVALLLCTALQIGEGALPRIPVFPWLKLGLSYAIVLPFWMCYGTRAAVALVAGRNLLTFLLSGQPVTTFLIGTFSAATAFALIGAPLRLGVRAGWVGWAGAGMVLAAAMNLLQLVAVEWAFIRHSGFYFQAAPMLAWSVVSGCAVAWAAHALHPALFRLFDTGSGLLAGHPGGGQAASGSTGSPEERRNAGAGGSGFDRLRSGRFALAGLRLVLALLLPGVLAQAWLGLATLGWVAMDRSVPPGRLFRLLLGAWPLFLFQAVLHLGYGEGRLIAWGWVTAEGVEAFAENALRLANALLAGPALLAAWPRRWKGELSAPSAPTASSWIRPYARGFALALEWAPDLLGVWFGMRRQWRRLFRPREWESLLKEALCASVYVRGNETGGFHNLV